MTSSATWQAALHAEEQMKRTREDWPEGVFFRALTVGWATADVLDTITPSTYLTKHVLSAHCTGEGCPWKAGGGDNWTFTMPENSPDESHRMFQASKYDLQRHAENHAENCRAMRRPTQ